jgi:hypothetical protein
MWKFRMARVVCLSILHVKVPLTTSLEQHYMWGASGKITKIMTETGVEPAIS